jgi:predicted porin
MTPVLAAGGQPAGSGDRWSSDLYLYIWGQSLKGTAAVRGNEFDVDESFSDLIENLAGAFSARFESHKGSFGYFLDGMYVKLDPSASTPAGSVDAELKQLVLEAGGAYYFSPVIQALAGVRYQELDLDVKLPNGAKFDANQDWADAIVGFRFVPLITDKWRLWFRGDVGIFGDSETTWNAAVGARYNFNKKWSGLLAYRYLSNDFEDKGSGFKYDIGASGLGLAVGYSF